MPEKRASKTAISRVRNLLDGYRLPHGYEMVIRLSGSARTRAAIAKAERKRKRGSTKKTGKRRARDSRGRFK